MRIKYCIIIAVVKERTDPSMKKSFGVLPSGEQTHLYTIRGGALEAEVCDFAAAIVRLRFTDAQHNTTDVVLGYDDVTQYYTERDYIGATVGLSANRICKGRFPMGDRMIQMDQNDKGNNLHSGKDSFAFRMWKVEKHTENSIVLYNFSPDGDQGLPGNAHVRVTFTLEHPASLRIRYEGICDRDTVFNMTNHAYFNLAGHDKPHLAMDQLLMMPARHYTAADALSIPTGELRPVAGTPMDFRIPKPIGRDLNQDYECLKLAGGYDHNFEVFAQPCAVLTDPHSGRSMAMYTDRPGLQFYSGNYLCNVRGKDGVTYGKNSGVALESQFYPDSVNHPQWEQPFVPANTPYHSETVYTFR